MKTLKTIALLLIFLFCFPLTAYAEESFEKYQEEYYELFSDELSEKTVEILEKSGFDSIDFEKVLSAEPKDIISFFVGCAEGSIDGPLKHFILSTIISVFISIAFSYLSEDEKKRKAVTLLVCAYISISVCFSTVHLLSAGVASIKMSSNFMLMFLPVLAGIIAASNNPVLALNYNSMTLYFTEAVSAFAANILVPFEGMLFVLVSIGMVSDTMHIKNIAGIIKNGVKKTLTVLATIFTAILSVKGILSNVADTVANKGAKMLVSSVVPVIGGSMSEAYGSVISSLMLLKSSVGIFGILVIAAINLPVIFELTFWALSLTCSGVVADVFGLKNIADFFRDISDVIKTFSAILIFCCVLFIISTGILLVIKNSV